MAKSLNTKILTANELEFLKEKVETLLSAKGVKIDHPQAMEALRNGGAEVDTATGLVKFPKTVIDKALQSVPKTFTLAAPDPQYDLTFPHPDGAFYTRTCTGGMNYLTAGGEYHNVTIAEVAEWSKLINSLPHIDFCALPSTSGKSVPGEAIDIHTLRTMLEHSKKHIWVQPYEAANVKYLLELAAARAGGKEELKKRPIISFITCSVPPFQYKYMDMEALYQSCLYGVPIQPCSLPAAGANAPVTPQGIALLASTEVMAQIIMAQLIAPGLPVIATPLLFAMDMLTTYTLQSPIETTMGRMVAMQLFEDGYNIPAHSYGTGTDSFLLDGQCMAERTSLAHMLALAGASVLGGAGQLEVAKTISPLQLIIDNDIFAMTKKLLRGLEINEDMLAWNEVMELTGKESFVDMDHTFEHFRDSLRLPTFNRDSRPNWVKAGSKDMLARAKDVYQNIMSTYEPSAVPAEVLRNMDEIVQQADKQLITK
ncbi:trimethylamine methyltransferase family protein [Sporomusa aerivorans]|uniref:trimethylamine methyltransferase family protein n=1 Tax=Sporomusa aerivorans TaxID=204936 RepID=UPI00352B9853